MMTDRACHSEEWVGLSGLLREVLTSKNKSGLFFSVEEIGRAHV